MGLASNGIPQKSISFVYSFQDQGKTKISQLKLSPLQRTIEYLYRIKVKSNSLSLKGSIELSPFQKTEPLKNLKVLYRFRDITSQVALSFHQ
jgi:hypothetical protein